MLIKQQNDPIIVDVVSKLQEIYNELPLVHWSNNSIFDAIEQWKIEKGEYPSASDLDKKGLPCRSVIKQKLKIDPVIFLKQHFSRTLSMEHISPYYNKSKEEWLDEFIREYNRIEPMTYAEFEKKRNKSTPTARWIMNQFEIKTWNDLIMFSGVKPYKKKNNVKKRFFNVSNQSKLF